LAMAATGCGTTDWQRDLLAGLVGLAPGFIPIPLPGPAGPAGPAGQDGAPGAPGAPGPNIIIARAVVNSDGTLENSDDVAVAHALGTGLYELTIDVTGDVLPAGTTEDDFEVFLTLKEGSDLERLEAFYSPISLVGTDLRIDVLFSNGDGLTDHAFTVQVLLPAG